MLLRLFAAGEVEWRRQFGTGRWDDIHGLVLTSGATERILAAGCQNWDQCQAFLREFDSAGNELWSVVIPTGQTVCGTQIATDAASSVCQTGGTHGPAFGDYAGGGGDVVLVKLGRK